MHRSRRKCISQSGSVALETTIALSTLVTLISGGLALSYFIFAKVWLAHAAYEASICLSTPEFEAECEGKLKNQISGALPIGEVGRTQLMRNPIETSVSFTWSVANGIAIRIEDHRDLQLVKEQI